MFIFCLNSASYIHWINSMIFILFCIIFPCVPILKLHKPGQSNPDSEIPSFSHAISLVSCTSNKILSVFPYYLSMATHTDCHHFSSSLNIHIIVSLACISESSQSRKALGVAWPDWNGLASVECPPQNFWPVVSRGPTSTRPQTFLSYHNPALVTSWNIGCCFQGSEELWHHSPLCLSPESSSVRGKVIDR